VSIVFLLQDTGAIHGAERATLDLVGGLCRAGATCTISLIEEDRLNLSSSPLRQAFEALNVPVLRHRVAGRFSRALVQSIRDDIRSSGGTVLHSVGYKANLHAGAATRWGRDVPHVCTVHGWLFRPDLKERFYGWLDVQVMRRATAVVTLSRYYEDRLLREGIRRERLYRIPSGIATAELDRIRRPDWGRTPEVGIIGRLSWEKNHGLFLDAASLIRKAGVPCRFLIAGDGPEKERIQQRIEALGLQSLVSAPGFVSREDFLKRAHVVVLSSRIENLPYSIMEAMACSRPVVATNVGGLGDLVDSGETGFLVPETKEALAEAVIKLVKDPALAQRMGASGRMKFLGEFALERMVGEHLRLYEALR